MRFPAARLTDMHTCPMCMGVPAPIAWKCAWTVWTGKMPQARVTDLCVCVGPPPPIGGDPIVTGAWNVLAEGMPAARMTDLTGKGGTIVTGFPTVLIGMQGKGATHQQSNLDNFSAQEQSNSCVIATSRNMIRYYTGVDIPEEVLRDEMRQIMNRPDHNFETQPINPAFAEQLLENHGVPVTVRNNQTLDDIENLTAGGDPVMVGFTNPGHRVAVSNVETDANGNRTFVVMDPAPTYNGQPRRMSESDFNNRYNPNAIVIDPD
ncbi:MAG: PAAR domain-containing protein [Roseibium sp.]|uniref:PAAR domain-containing protein n=1 Tax=Roseibium sp. TaxID=1936156 RepID=UPI00261CEADD|nr:PAAR domain-containing protein [Roseibium sp.]MCV0424301.1 PAAR domain-containing protein [Roseibium sp.]